LKVPSREQLLSEYALKPVRRFAQIDCWEEDGGNTVLPGDGERYVVMGGETYELRNTDFPVRIQIADGADKETVLDLLAKAYSVLAEDWEAYGNPSGRPPLPNSGEQSEQAGERLE
jgi:hypothetical protein